MFEPSLMNQLSQSDMEDLARVTYDMDYEMSDLQLDDLREHDNEDLMSKFDISSQVARLFMLVIQGEQNSQYSLYGIPDERAEQFLQEAQEACHGEYPGYTVSERAIIRAFMADLTNAMYRNRRQDA